MSYWAKYIKTEDSIISLIFSPDGLLLMGLLQNNLEIFVFNSADGSLKMCVKIGVQTP